MAPKNQPSAEAKNSFEFSQGGVGLYIARSPEEEQDWARWIRRWSESDNCNLMEFSVTELMSASNILPPRDGIEEASIDLFEDRKSTRLNSGHPAGYRMPSSA